MQDKLDSLVNLRAMVDVILAPDVYYERNAAKMEIQQVFCVRNDKNGLLDVARLAYVQCLKEMEQLVEQYVYDTGVRYAVSVGSTVHLNQKKQSWRSILCVWQMLLCLMLL
jgi:hypothetical protein